MITRPTRVSYKVRVLIDYQRSRLTGTDHVKLRLELRKRKHDDISESTISTERLAGRGSFENATEGEVLSDIIGMMIFLLIHDDH